MTGNVVSVFGLALATPVSLPGLTCRTDRSPEIELRLASLAGFDTASATRLGGLHPTGAAAATLTVSRDDAGTYLADAPGILRATISPGRLHCVALGASWKTMLVDQILPLAAASRGCFVLHATAVRIGATAVLIAGPSGAGKSSVVAQMLRRGASLHSEDVTAIDVSTDQPVAAAGPSWLRLRPDQADALRELPGAVRVGPTPHGKTAWELPVSDDLVKVTALVELGSSTMDLQHESALGPVDVIAHLFVPYLNSATDLARQFEASTLIARKVAWYRVGRPSGGPATVAAQILEMLGSR